MPVAARTDTNPRFSQMSDSYAPHVTNTRSATGAGSARNARTNSRTGRHSRSGRLRQPAPAPANEPDCSSRRPKNPGSGACHRERRHRAEARPHHAAAGRVGSEGKLCLEPGNELVDQVPVMARIVGVLDQPLARVAERSHDGRQVAAVDEVVQHRRSRGVAEVVAAVEHDHQRVRRFRLVGEARRQIHACSRRAGQRRALADPLDEPARGHCFVVLRPWRAPRSREPRTPSSRRTGLLLHCG